MTLVLVTGGAGFIGSHTVDLLIGRGYSVRVLDLLQERVHPKGKPPYLPPSVDFIQGDVADRPVMERALDGVRMVLHLAAYQDYMPDFSHFIHSNTESSALLFEIIVGKKLPVGKIVFASSQAVSGEGKYRCHEHGIVYPGPRPALRLERGQWEQVCPVCGGGVTPELITEDVARPHTAYGISKYAIELLAHSLGRRYGIPTVCLRYTYVQGPRNSFYNAYSGVMRRFALRLLNDQPPLIYEDGRQLRDYVNVADVARANVLAMERAEADFRVFNIGGGKGVTVLEFARIAARVFNKDIEPLVSGEYRVGDTRHTVSDISAIRALGWAPQVSIEASVAQYRDWLVTQDVDAGLVTRADAAMREAQVVRPVRARGTRK
jgi:dTDP-L-rhamnose 4-epimerase